MAKKGNRNYKRGREFEYKTRNHLSLKLGATYVMRAAQSKGAADLIALFPKSNASHCPRVWLVQCKRDGKLPPAEREQLIHLAKRTGAKAMHAYQGPRGTPVVIDEIGAS